MFTLLADDAARSDRALESFEGARSISGRCLGPPPIVVDTIG